MKLDDYKGHELHEPKRITSRRTIKGRINVYLDGQHVRSLYYPSYSPQMRRKAIARAQAWIDKQPQTETAQ